MREITFHEVGMENFGPYIEPMVLTFENDFMVVEKIDRDITNRGITSSMSHADKFQKFLEIKEIAEDDHEQYLKKALELVDRCEG